MAVDPSTVLDIGQQLQAFAAGPYRKGLFKGLIGKPPYEPGERLVSRLGREGVRRMALTATPRDVAERAFLDDPRTLHGQGTLLTTDRRARLIGNGGKVLREWRFEDLRDVYAMVDGAGVHFVRPDDTDSAEVALHSYANVVGAQSRRSIGVHHLETELAWQLFRGVDLGSWLSRLPARFGLDL